MYRNPLSFPILFLLLLSILSSESCAQSLKYEIVKGNKVIGEMTCDKFVENDTLVYLIKSESKIKLIFTFNVSYFMHEKFVGGELVLGNATNSLGGRVQKESYITRDANQYVVNMNGSIKRFLGIDIFYSVPELYFSEPGERTRIFSQQFVGFLKIEKTGAKVYTMTSDDGKNVYTYNEKGICEEVKVSRAYATFYFKLLE